MSAGPRVALTLALLVALPGGVLAVPGVAGQDAPQPQVAGDDPALTMTVDLRPNGDARWRVSTSFTLTTDAERESFRNLAESFENGETSALGLRAFRRASQEASETTGREMAITDVERRSSPDPEIGNGTGRLTVEFTWTNFARTDRDRLHVDDVFAAGPDGETWLPGLEADDEFVMRSPEGYGVASSSVPPRSRDNRSVLRWSGPATFNASDLSAEFTGQAATPTRIPPGGPQGSVPWLLLFTLGVGGGVVAAYLIARRRGGFDLPPTPAEADAGADTGGGDADATAESGAETAGAAQPDAAGTETADEEEPGAPGMDEELLSDEERVELLLERNGGRMKQADIVKETGWSNAKVSQLLSSMEEEDRVDKLRIGRENLISFPNEDVTGPGE
jgi:hypothetical protein